MSKFSSTDSGATVLSKLNNTIVTVGTQTGADYVCDGTADDVQIQAAIDEVSVAGGGIVQLRRGTYNCSSSVYIKNNITLIGEGMDVTILLAVNGIANAILVSDITDSPYDLMENIVIKDLQFDCDAISGISGIWISRFDGLYLERVKVKDVNHNWGYHFGAVADVDETVNKSQNLVVKDCILDGHTNSTLECMILSNTNKFILDNLQFLNVTTLSRKIYLYVWNRHGIIRNCKFDQDQQKYLITSIAEDIVFENCYFYSSTTSGTPQLTLLNSKDIKVKNCQFVGTADSYGVVHYDYNTPIDGSWPITGFEYSDNILIDGCTFHNHYSAICFVSQTQSDKNKGFTNLRVTNCYFKNYTNEGIYAGHTTLDRTLENITISNNVFETNDTTTHYGVRIIAETNYHAKDVNLNNNIFKLTGGNGTSFNGSFVQYSTISNNRMSHYGTGKNINCADDDYLMIHENYFDAAITAAGANNIIANNNI